MRNPINRYAAFFLAGGFVAVVFLAGAAHAITDSIFKYSTVQKGYLGLPPAAFAAAGSSSQYLTYNDGSLLQVPADGTCVWAPVNLPQGAVMTDFAVWYAKISGDATFKLVTMEDSAGGYDEILSVPLADTNFTRVGLNRSIPSASGKIDNARHTYWIYFCTDNSNATYFTTVRIAYTYNNAGS